MKNVNQLAQEAIVLSQIIAEHEAKLATVKDQLKDVARDDKEHHVTTDGGGWSWTAEALGGNIVRVTQSGPSLRSKFDSESDIVEKVLALTKNAFSDLFPHKVVYSATNDLESRAVRRLGAPDAKKLLKLLSVPGRMSVSFEIKEGR